MVNTYKYNFQQGRELITGENDQDYFCLHVNQCSTVETITCFTKKVLVICLYIYMVLIIYEFVSRVAHLLFSLANALFSDPWGPFASQQKHSYIIRRYIFFLYPNAEIEPLIYGTSVYLRVWCELTFWNQFRREQDLKWWLKSWYTLINRLPIAFSITPYHWAIPLITDLRNKI